MPQRIKNNDIPKPDFDKLRKQKIRTLEQTFKVLFCSLKRPPKLKPSSGGRKITSSKQEDKNEVHKGT